MRYLLLFAGLLLAGRSWGQGTIQEQFVGVWKVKIRCVESFCKERAANEPATNSLSAYTWTISQAGADNSFFTLQCSDKRIGTMTGVFDGANAVFEGTANAFGVPLTSNRIVLKQADGKLSGTYWTGRTDGSTGVCMWRFSITGTQ